MKPEYQFTPNALLALERADAFRRELDHGFIGTEHLLFGVMQSEGGIGKMLLERHKLGENELRFELDPNFERPEKPLPQAQSLFELNRTLDILTTCLRDLSEDHPDRGKIAAHIAEVTAHILNLTRPQG